MDEAFLKDRAKTVRALAEKADPFTRIRLLELADRYERRPRPPTPIPSVPVKTTQLTNAVELVEEILSSPNGQPQGTSG